MDVNEDFVDIAKGFIDNGVEFLIVGAYALVSPPGSWFVYSCARIPENHGRHRHVR